MGSSPPRSYPPIASPLPRSPMSTMHYIYGPIPSRRLGRSLGVDPIPLKTCNWNCIYCQLGRSTPLTNERREYAPRGEILAELDGPQSSCAKRDRLHLLCRFRRAYAPLGLGWLVHQVKARTAIPVAVITNGSLLYLPEVRTALLPADVVMPTLSAGTPPSTGRSTPPPRRYLRTAGDRNHCLSRRISGSPLDRGHAAAGGERQRSRTACTGRSAP